MAYAWSVYVIELHRDVLTKKRFREANPKHKPDMPCVYVGMTGLTHEQRFANHKRGWKGNSYVKAYGIKFMPALYAHLSRMDYYEALKAEANLAEELRRKGYAVWQH